MHKLAVIVQVARAQTSRVCRQLMRKLDWEMHKLAVCVCVRARRRLMRKLDWEKGITVENPLIPPKSEEDQAAQAEAAAADASAAAAAKGVHMIGRCEGMGVHTFGQCRWR